MTSTKPVGDMKSPCNCPISVFERADGTITPIMNPSKEIPEGNMKLPAQLYCFRHGFIDITDEEFNAIKQQYDGDDFGWIIKGFE